MEKHKEYTSINNDNKRRLGILIKFERKRLNMMQKELTNDHGIRICSVATLRRIEASEIIKDDIIYHDLIKRLGYFFEENLVLDQFVSKLNEMCMHYFETLNLSEANIILDLIQSTFTTSSFYYTHLKKFYSDIIEFNMFKKILSQNEYLIYKHMINVTTGYINLFLIHTCFCYANNYTQNIQEMLYYEDLLKKNFHWLIIRIDYQLILKCNNRLEEYLELNSLIINETKQKQLINQRCKAIASRCSVLSTVHLPLLEQSLNDLEILIKNFQESINPIIVSNIKYTMAMVYYADVCDYLKAKVLLEAVLIDNPLKIESAGIYYFTACEKIGKNPSAIILDNISLENSNIYLKYFKFKYQYKWTKKELARYLNTVITKGLLQDQNYLKTRVFKAQWKYIMQDNADQYYKSYYRFMDNFE